MLFPKSVILLLLFRQFTNASAADLFVKMIRQILGVSAKNAAKLAFLQDDGIAVRKDLQIIILIDVQILPKLLRKDKPAQ